MINFYVIYANLQRRAVRDALTCRKLATLSVWREETASAFVCVLVGITHGDDSHTSARTDGSSPERALLCAQYFSCALAVRACVH